MAFESLRLNDSRRASTFEWLSKARESHINHEMMIERFEKCYNHHADDIDPTQKPVNILCFDGGGLKGYGLIKMVEAIQEKCKEKGNFCQQFDLIGGTSVGGIKAILNNVFDSTEDAIVEAADVIDECREKTFSKINYLNVLLKGKAVGNDDDSLLKIFKDRFGSDKPLFNPDGIPCFVLSSSRRNEGNGSTSKCEAGDIYEPFIFRTYNYPEKDDDSVTTQSSLDLELAESSSSISLYEAMAATSAVPGLVDRVRVNVDGVERRFADGNVFANNPIVIALNEAKRLYPTRPLGLVMSIGFGTASYDLVNRAIDICRLSHPNLHYHRICPKRVFEGITAQETDLAKLAVMEEEAFDFVMNDPGVNRLLDVSLEKLFAHQPQWQEGDINTSTFLRSSTLSSSSTSSRSLRSTRSSRSSRSSSRSSLSRSSSRRRSSRLSTLRGSVSYQRRTQHRLSVISVDCVKSKRLRAQLEKDIVDVTKCCFPLLFRKRKKFASFGNRFKMANKKDTKNKLKNMKTESLEDDISGKDLGETIRL